MTASDHVHPEQLRMLMTAQELHDTDSIDVMQTPESRFGGAWKTKEAMWKTKRAENKKSGLDRDIAARGVQEPVELTSGKDHIGSVIRNGHHRIEAAYRSDPQQLLMVKHTSTDNWWQ